MAGWGEAGATYQPARRAAISPAARSWNRARRPGRRGAAAADGAPHRWGSVLWVAGFGGRLPVLAVGGAVRGSDCPGRGFGCRTPVRLPGPWLECRTRVRLPGPWLR